MKTKLGISVGLFGALMYFAALFGGYIPVILMAGYVLFIEENEWLKKAAVKAVVVLVSFSFLLALINLIPDCLSWVNSLVSVFKGSFNYSIVSSIINVITKAVNIIRTCVFLLLGAKAFNQGTVTVPVADQIVNKHL